MDHLTSEPTVRSDVIFGHTRLAEGGIPQARVKDLVMNAVRLPLFPRNHHALFRVYPRFDGLNTWYESIVGAFSGDLGLTQGWSCCDCMGKIEETFAGMSTEHWTPHSMSKEQA